jgi:general secretion pathway protein E
MGVEDLSAVLLFHNILSEAMEKGCSDIHLYPTNDGQVAVQFRIKGQLQAYARLETLGLDLVRRVKALARMDITETRIPQDGAFQWESEALSTSCDIRVATLPTIYGEAMVLRLLSARHSSLTFSALGMSEHQAHLLVSLLHGSNGMVLVAGPTGSGKTTTLYTMMLQLASWGKKVVSIEDPVEMALADCHQVEVREKTGVTFEVGLKALLRQDPDVIMVGEIRDESTARTALRAALTGHLVLSTTHAFDIVGAAARLVDFGASRSLVGEVLRGVVVQHRRGRNEPNEREAQGEYTHAPHQTGSPQFDIQTMGEPFVSWLSSGLAWQEMRNQMRYTPSPVVTQR